MKSSLSKKDVLWSYLAKAFSILTGIITLPLILRWLSSEEIAVNYLFLNIISYTVIFDMGFSQQFSRNISFAFGGVSAIKKEGFFENSAEKEPNYKLIKTVVSAAHYLYLRSAIIVFLVLVSLGTWYVLKMTNGYSLNNEILGMWILFSVFESFDFYYKIYGPLLLGKGFIGEVCKMDFFSSLIKLLITLVLLLIGLRLWAVLIGILSKIVFGRIMCIYYFYYKDSLKSKLDNYSISESEKHSLIKKLWYNAKKSALVQVATFCSTQLGFLFAGIYLLPSEISAYGLLMQLTSIFYTIAMSLSGSATPIYSQLRANGDFVGLKKLFFFTTGMYYLVFFLGSLVLLFVCPIILEFIKSNVTLPSLLVIAIYLIYKFLEGQHCICIYCLSSNNKIYDMESAVIMAFASVLLLYFSMKYTSMGLVGLVLVQFLVAFVYANWKWPYVLCKELNIRYISMVNSSIYEVFNKGKQELHKLIISF